MRVRPRRARRPSHAASEVVKAAVAEAKSRAVGVDRADCGNVRFIVLPEVTTDDDSVFLWVVKSEERALQRSAGARG